MLGQMALKNATLAEFANFVQRYVLDRPVLDDSGVIGADTTSSWIGRWMILTSVYRASQLPAPSRSVEPPDLFTAFREQLGLRLMASEGLRPGSGCRSGGEAD